MATRGGVSLRRLFGIGFQPGDKTLEIVRRQCLPADDHQRVLRQQADGLEIPDEVVWQRINRAVHHMSVPLADVDRVAVGGGTGDPADADATLGGPDILDHDGLPERRPHPFGHDAGEHIGRSAGGNGTTA
jgi:hypothetical protein